MPTDRLREQVEAAISMMRSGRPRGARLAELWLRQVDEPPEDYGTTWAEVEANVNAELSMLAAAVSAGQHYHAVELASELHRRGLTVHHVGMTEHELVVRVRQWLDTAFESLGDDDDEAHWSYLERLHEAVAARVQIEGLAKLLEALREETRPLFEYMLSRAREGSEACMEELVVRCLAYGEAAGVTPESLGMTEEEHRYFGEVAKCRGEARLREYGDQAE